MSKKPCPIFIVYSIQINGQDVLDYTERERERERETERERERETERDRNIDGGRDRKFFLFGNMTEA